MPGGEQAATDRFVNPYTFVGLPTNVPRRKPYGHDVVRDSHGAVAEDLWYGTIDVTWTLETPLLLPKEAEREGWVQAAPGGRHEVRIPGSSIKGAVRSLHETLFNGCLRIVDEDFVPGYRDAARQRSDPAPEDAWQLAVVESLKDGNPQSVRLCEQRTVWVEATSLMRAYRNNKLPQTSDVFDLVGDQEEASLRVNGTEVHRVEAVRNITSLDPVDPAKNDALPASARAGRQVLLVSDTAARKQTRAERTARGRAFWAVGTLTEESAPVSAAAWEDFTRAVAGSRDREEVRRETDRPLRNRYRPVEWWPNIDGPLDRFDRAKRAIARRKEASGFLYVGDVVWVRLGSDPERQGARAVTRIKLSQLWRHTGSGPTKSRVPKAVLPCTHPYEEGKGLCLSCLIFGSADTKGESAGEGRQDAYAGRVRIGSARTEQPVELDAVTLSPMGNPHPGAGMFYLRSTRPAGQRPDGDLPSKWGSADDDRSLRGRKYYWHADPDAQARFWSSELGRGNVRPRYQARPHQERSASGERSQFVRDASLVPTGTQLRQRIHVNGLTRLGVVTLLGSLQPERVLHQLPGAQGRRLALRLGGGKPLGLGSARAQVVASLTTAADRYTASAPKSHGAEDFVVSLRDLLAAGQLCRYAAQLARVLDIDGLGDWRNHVSYPSGAEWSAINSKQFDESFEFFRENSGEMLKSRPPRPYEPLPEVPTDLRTGFDPTQPVARRASSGGGRGSRGGRR